MKKKKKRVKLRGKKKKTAAPSFVKLAFCPSGRKKVEMKSQEKSELKQQETKIGRTGPPYLY